MKIPKRIAQTLMNSLKGGVVPRVGLNYVTVGRTAEIDALLLGETIPSGSDQGEELAVELHVAWTDDVRLDNRANLNLSQLLIVLVCISLKTKRSTHKMDFHNLCF